MPTLEFKGKNFVRSHHHSVPFRELRPHADSTKSRPHESIAPSLEDNLIIHGDNLHALKALLPNYAGRIKCIYIDPPYNTGNEGWCYNDKVNSPLMREWLKKEANPVDKEDMERHDKWLCMMYPRLTLLHELLADDGVIFVSIDDNEVHHLRCVMDEIFEQENFIVEAPTIMNLKGNNDQYAFSGTHEYTIVYTKNKLHSSFNELNLSEDEEGWLLDEKGLYKKGKVLLAAGEGKLRNERQKMYFPVLVKGENAYLIEREEYEKIYNPSDDTFDDDYVEQLKDKYQKEGFAFVLPIDSENIKLRWSWGYDGKFQTELDEVIVNRTKNGISLYKKQRPSLGELPTKKPKSTFYKPEYSSGNGTNLLKEIFSGKLFQNPKPLQLIKDFLEIATAPDSIVLDSFAGSGTTAHAVLALNKQDGGNRKFILIECEDYADSITAERVRRVIDGVPTAKDPALKAGLGGSFTFTQLGEPMQIETLLTAGDTENPLPAYDALARYIFYTATGGSLPQSATLRTDFYVGENATHAVYLIYQPDKAFLRSNASALNAEKLELIKSHGSKKEKLVYATAKYMGADSLKDHRITFCQLPYAIHKVIG